MYIVIYIYIYTHVCHDCEMSDRRKDLKLEFINLGNSI